MMWQDFIFTAGSIFGIIALTPTLRDRMATVPLGTSMPSALIGIVYGFTFFTMGMTFSAVGALTTGTLWSCIAALRSPKPDVTELADSIPIDTDDQQGYSPAGD